MSAVPVESLGELHAYAEEVSGCTRCRLAQGRTQVVFGAGNPHAGLMFVGEAPGFHEDKQGIPFVGQAGKLLEKLLAGIGMARSDVYIANVLKCRPPGNRDPQPEEIDACWPWLEAQLDLIQPKVVVTLGNFATKLLSGRQLGITKVHGQEQQTTIGGRDVLLYPLYHPAAASSPSSRATGRRAASSCSSSPTSPRPNSGTRPRATRRRRSCARAPHG